MHVDEFIVWHQGEWARLETLVRRARRLRRHRLDPAELDELTSLYQRSAGHLSYATTNFADPGLIARLSRLVGDAAALIYGARRPNRRAPVRFFTDTFPNAVWQLRRMVLLSAVLTFVPALAVGAWFANSPSAIDASTPAALRQAYVQHEFADYYTSEPAAAFAAQVYTNNVRVGALAFASGILAGVPTVYLLVSNGANVGEAAGLFTAAGQAGKFWGLLVPHGLLELTSVVLAGAAGMRLGWTLVDPGDRRRVDALAEEAQRAVVLVLGTVATFAVAGAIEAFVTGSGLPTALRVGVGVLAEAALVTLVAAAALRSARDDPACDRSA
ncbi:MAG: stage II sporulation protein M [Acidimicrobiales bacterium]